MISIITTTYNSATFIERTVKSVLNQKVDCEFEYIISDDFSSDNTIELINAIKKNHPKGHVIRLIHQKENLGVMKNFFYAVSKTKGRYIAFCDSDDIWVDDKKLFKQREYLNNNPSASIAYSGYINILEEGISKNYASKFWYVLSSRVHPLILHTD